jgi:hypothetical protein
VDLAATRSIKYIESGNFWKYGYVTWRHRVKGTSVSGGRLSDGLHVTRDIQMKSALRNCSVRTLYVCRRAASLTADRETLRCDEQVYCFHVTGMALCSLSNRHTERVLQELGDSQLCDLTDSEDTTLEPEEYLNTGTEYVFVEPKTVADTSPESGPSSTESVAAKELRPKWRQRRFSRRNARFTGSGVTSGEEGKSPVGYFIVYITRGIFELFSTQTNFHSVQKSGTSPTCTCFDIRQWLGALIIK